MKDYSQREKTFLQMTITGIRHRPDGMIEIPLPFKTEQPQFIKNRTVALKRTEATLRKLKQTNPVMHESSLKKFSKNIDLPFPRFIPTPPKNSNGHRTDMHTGSHSFQSGRKKKPE